MDKNNITYMIAKNIVEIVSSPFHIVKEVVKILNDYGIDYAITGAIAMETYNYKRATDDIDIIISKEGFKKLQKLEGRYFHFRHGTKKNFYYNASFGKVEVDIIVEGENKSGVVMPNPKTIRTKIGGIYYIHLKKLLELKLAGGNQKMREYDWPDVIRLIRENNLDNDYYTNFLKYKKKYLELWEKAQEE
jgi:hypothetical protein